MDRSPYDANDPAGRKATQRLVYNARMKYIRGHVPLAHSSSNAGVWTTERPSHVAPRAKASFAGASSRPKSAAADVQRRRPSAASETDDGELRFKHLFARQANASNMPLEARLELRRESIARSRQAGELLPEHEPPNAERGAWQRTYQAGCWFWINAATGAAATTIDDGAKSLAPRVAAAEYGGDGMATAVETEDTDGKHWGTGALVYDPSEFEELVRILDGEARRRTRSKSRPKSAPGNKKSPTDAHRASLNLR
ncbi:hypothetical protein M885DRAFT_552622 [Pelagophyceae sp. CCMP2097]|nr:hypothetical protein M885DRAFT_552622 [Pelagophyceae sp. CCMP2097]|mmetsp:Transcript_4925/g.17572  ORF Transcript_4925/g.17572 Transcript_4925/m.17572 type:complete len:255 (+) Transcript_4925:175-939(+)